MKKAEEIYQTALLLLGEDSAEETAAFETRYLPLLNLLLAETRELCDALRGDRKNEHVQVTGPLDPVGVPDAVAEGLLPLGLAGLLIQGEEPERAAFFLNRYDTERLRLESRGRKGRRHAISRPY